MRILIHSLNFWPEPTATGKYTGDMAIWLAKQGHSVEVIAGFPHYPDWQLGSGWTRQRLVVEQAEGLTIRRTPHYIPPPEKVTALRRICMEVSFSLWGLFWWIPILFWRRKFDAVIAVCPPMQTGVMPTIYRLLRRTPWIFLIQDFQVDAAFRLNMLGSSSAARVLLRLERWLLQRASRVATISRAMCRRAISKGANPDSTLLVPNWADLSRITPSLRLNAFRTELGIRDTQILVMYAGAMGKKQGLEIVLKSASLLRHQPRFHFVLIGAGTERALLQEQAAAEDLKNMTILPVQPLERLNEVFAAADIQLVIQKQEAEDLVMPSKLTNILASGRPCVATAREGSELYEVICGHRTGIATMPGDAAALTSALQDLADSPDLRDELGKNAHQFANRFLNQGSVLETFQNEIAKLAAAQ